MKNIILIILLCISTITFAQQIEWFTFGSGLSSPPAAVAVMGNKVFVGGSFALAGGIQVNGIAMWDGIQWSGLGSGINGNVYALAVVGDYLYASGSFSSAGGIAVNNIAKWDGSNWSAVGLGLNSDAICLYADGTDLYAGGFFTEAGGFPASRIAKWDGTSWSPLGNGVNNEVDVISVSGNDVYAGGIFTNAGGLTVHGLARWDGTTWNNVGNGVNGYVKGISIINGDIYVGGIFTMAGGTVQGRIARYDGTSWYPLGDGVDGSVLCMMRSFDDIYVGGLFSNAGGHPASRIAKYNTSTGSWSPIAEGVTAEVDAMAIQGTSNSLVIGGAFSHVGNNIEANYIARFTDTENPLPVELLSFTGQQDGQRILLKWYTAQETNNNGFEIQRKNSESNIGADNEYGNREWKAVGFISGHGTTTELNHYIFIDDNIDAGSYAYRLKQIDFDGTSRYSDEILVEFKNVREFSLEQNFPNPFNPVTTIKYSIPEVSNVRITVFDVSGRKVRTLVNTWQAAGSYLTRFDAANLSSGIYFYRLTAGSLQETRKLLLMK